nr:hypothetical protein [Tanacetum cinerariifolium]
VTPPCWPMDVWSSAMALSSPASESCAARGCCTRRRIVVALQAQPDRPAAAVHPADGRLATDPADHAAQRGACGRPVDHAVHDGAAVRLEPACLRRRWLLVFQPGGVAIDLRTRRRLRDAHPATFQPAPDRAPGMAAAAVSVGCGLLADGRHPHLPLEIPRRSRCAAAQSVHRPDLPDQQNRLVATAVAAFRGAGVRGRQIAASVHDLAGQLARPANLPHGPLLAGNLLPGRAPRAAGGWRQRAGR